MERSGFLIFLFLLNILIYCGGYWKVSGSCLDSDRKALTTFRKALNDRHNILSSWDDEASDCCKWRGITCHNITRFVLKLDLNNYDDEYSLSGRIDPAVVELKHLQLLDLSYNDFYGIPIPEFLGSMKELRHLNLSYAGFSGRIPHQLGNLSHLISLQLSSYTYYSPSAKNLWWLTSLPSLKYLDMSYVNLSMASHDWVHVMNKCPSLVELRLVECGLSYISPSLASVNFTSLRVLDLCENNFNSRIPKWIGNISSLVSLNLSFCNFDGPVPYQFSQLPNLEELKLGGSLCPNCSQLPEGSWSKLKLLYLYFSELHDGIPNSIWNITSLQSLYLCFYENARGCIPRAITELVNLESLSLYGSQINAPIPEWFNELRSLKYIGLHNCMLTGPIPAALGGLSSLQSLDLSWNQLNGSIPTALGGLSSLQSLDLRDNQLNGSIPAALGGLSSLQSLDLRDNQLNGSIPAALGGLSSLQSLDLSGNRLNGSIPAALGGLSSLQSLDLSDNHLNGNIPTTLGQLSNLSTLELSNNSLTGNVSETHFENLKKLNYLDLSFNCLVFDIHRDWVPPFQLSTISLTSSHLGLPPWIRTQKYIQELDLSNTTIFGVIPNWFWDFTTQLCSLDLSNNQISGQLPNPLKMQPATYIDLSSNHFSGPIPCISNGSVILDLSNNQFSGPIPPNFTSAMHYLEIFFARGNQISGIIPSSIGKMKSLSDLDLSQNNLSGTIPLRLGDCVDLEVLDLNKNRLSGRIPISLKNCTNLETLDLGQNNFSGHIPTWIGKSFPYLGILSLRSNMFTGSIPPQLLNITFLEVLDVGQNCLSGSIPQSLQNLTAMKNEQKMDRFILNGTGSYHKENVHVSVKGLMLEYSRTTSLVTCMDLSSNNLSGEIPEGLTSLLGLRVLNLSENHLTGKIPEKIGKLALLMSLDFSKNQLSGTIPLSTGNMKYLSVLDLSRNNISGIIPLRLGYCVALEALDLSKNKLSGGIPRSLGLLRQLRIMQLSNNSLSGKIPLSLKKCASLETLDLGYNNFSGHIPTWIGESFPFLRVMSLRSNIFTGKIPPQLLNTSLQVFDVAQNCLSGSIPQGFENLIAMKNEQKVNLFHSYGGSYYEDHLLVSAKGQMLEYTRTILLVTCMDLSSNHLSGEIPKGLTSLLGLRILNLSGNHLTGKIPDKIGKLVLIESLDLSKNQLSGTIPPSMSSLTFLCYLNLSNNNLSGKIPSGNQLQTLQDPSIYMGNNDLCGPPLPDKCDSDETSQSPMPVGGDVKKDDEAHEMVWFYSALAPGFAVGFWAFCGVLVLKKAWRIAYYRFVDEMKERLLYSCRFAGC